MLVKGGYYIPALLSPLVATWLLSSTASMVSSNFGFSDETTFLEPWIGLTRTSDSELVMVSLRDCVIWRWDGSILQVFGNGPDEIVRGTCLRIAIPQVLIESLLGRLKDLVLRTK